MRETAGERISDRSFNETKDRACWIAGGPLSNRSSSSKFALCGRPGAKTLERPKRFPTRRKSRSHRRVRRVLPTSIRRNPLRVLRRLSAGLSAARTVHLHRPLPPLPAPSQAPRRPRRHDRPHLPRALNRCAQCSESLPPGIVSDPNCRRARERLRLCASKGGAVPNPPHVSKGGADFQPAACKQGWRGFPSRRGRAIASSPLRHQSPKRKLRKRPRKRPAAPARPQLCASRSDDATALPAAAGCKPAHPGGATRRYARGSIYTRNRAPRRLPSASDAPAMVTVSSSMPHTPRAEARSSPAVGSEAIDQMALVIG